MQLCMAEEQNLVLRLSRQRWKHPALCILGVWEGYAAAEEGGGDHGLKNQKERESRFVKDEGRGLI